MNNRKNMKSKQHGFTNGKSCSTNLINFSNEVTSLVDKETAVGIVYRDLRKAFDTISHKILQDKVLQSGLDEQAVRWIETAPTAKPIG